MKTIKVRLPYATVTADLVGKATVSELLMQVCGPSIYTSPFYRFTVDGIEADLTTEVNEKSEFVSVTKEVFMSCN